MQDNKQMRNVIYIVLGSDTLIHFAGVLMRRVSLVAVLVSVFSPAQAQDIDPLEVLSSLTDSVCTPISDVNTGSLVKAYFDADAEANLNGVLERFADLGLEGAGGFDTTEYVNGLAADALAGEINSQRDCNLRIYGDFSPLIQDWLTNEVGTGDIESNGDCSTNISGNGATSETNCTITN